MTACETAGFSKALTNSGARQFAVVLSCEHGGFQVPAQYDYLFRNNHAILKTHRGWDKGALLLAQELSKRLGAPLVASEVSRLLVDLNRSTHHRNIFSAFSKNCDTETKTSILRDYYLPYRREIESMVKKRAGGNKPVIHFSIHSFTSELDNQIRNCDIGLLYDSSRQNEKRLCLDLRRGMKNIAQTLIIRRNYPYRGKADGLTTYLRSVFSETDYLGVEIEINQKHVLPNQAKWSWLRQIVIRAIEQSVDSFDDKSRP